MTLRRLKLLTVGAPVALVALLLLAQRSLPAGSATSWPGFLLVAGGTLVAAALFSQAVFGVLERLRAGLAQQNRELLALHQAGLDIAGELELDAVLQKIVDAARELVGARYGALSVPRPGGGTEAFLTSGLSSAERSLLGPPPADHGLLDLVSEGHRLRIADVTRDPRARGFPPHHPVMRSLLAVPVRSGERVVGDLYLAEKEGAREFGPEDQETLARFATQAALAIENARLHRRVKALAIAEERERIAREMHDSLAQVLTYVGTKGHAAWALLERGQPEKAAAQIGQLTEAARESYADVREHILGLRTSLGADRGLLGTLREYVARWGERTDVSSELSVDLPREHPIHLPATGELQLVRIVQEALSNARKHARATRVRVLLREVGGSLEVVVEDDGVGFDPAAPDRGEFPRFGLATMRERAEDVGGTLQVDSRPGCGTRVVARLPLDTSIVGESDEGADSRRSPAGA